ncbi:hypothetical protein ACET3Z_028737 [Daucus carota]
MYALVTDLPTFGSDWLYLNVDEERLGTFSITPVGVTWASMKSLYFGESEGHLHYTDFCWYATSLSMYEMKSDYSGWFVKYRIDLAPIAKVFPEMKIFNYYHKHDYEVVVLSLVRRENFWENSFLVLKIPCKVIRYNVVDRSFKLLWDFGVTLNLYEIDGWALGDYKVCPNMGPVLCTKLQHAVGQVDSSYQVLNKIWSQVTLLKEVHPGAAKWQNTAMPWFKELSIIFGKDRATGNLAENLVDVVEELNKEADADELSGQDGMQPSAHSDESTSKKRKKGNVDSLLEAVYAASDRLANQFEASTKLLIAAEQDMIEKKKQLNEEISKIPGLQVLEKLQVAKKIAKDEDLMILFFAAPAEERSVFVQAILDDQICIKSPFILFLGIFDPTNLFLFLIVTHCYCMVYYLQV